MVSICLRFCLFARILLQSTASSNHANDASIDLSTLNATNTNDDAIAISSASESSPIANNVPMIHVIDEDESDEMAGDDESGVHYRRRRRSSNEKAGYFLDPWQLADHFSSV